MPIKILMPALSPTMTEGNLSKWTKKEGDTVKPGEVIAEIETDKATMEVEAVDEGKIGKILVPAGTQGVKVNQLIAVLLSDGETSVPDEFLKTTAVAAPIAVAAPANKNMSGAPVAAFRPAPAFSAARVFASPLAKRLAQQNDIDLRQVSGTGPHGRIVRSDVEKAIQNKRNNAGAGFPQGVDAIDYANKLGMGYELTPNSMVRKVIAKRLTEAKITIPHFYLTIDCEIDALLETRKEYNNANKDTKVSVNDFIIRAVALALKKVPAANASWAEAGVLTYKDVDVSIAVATPGGLVTPIIKKADGKNLGQLSTEMKDLAARARDNKLKPTEFMGGGFTISNLGMYGIKQFNAIINPPQGCILAVGAGEQRPIVKDGKLAIATIMTCTLSVDHRVVDGAVGAEFFQAFKKLIEEPAALV